jgi:hypothetical protein
MESEGRLFEFIVEWTGVEVEPIFETTRRYRSRW